MILNTIFTGSQVSRIRLPYQQQPSTASDNIKTVNLKPRSNLNLLLFII